MLRPAVNEILKDGQSYYSLVIAVAKRARQIAQEAEEEPLVPVSYTHLNTDEPPPRGGHFYWRQWRKSRLSLIHILLCAAPAKWQYPAGVHANSQHVLHF